MRFMIEQQIKMEISHSVSTDLILSYKITQPQHNIQGQQSFFQFSHSQTTRFVIASAILMLVTKLNASQSSQTNKTSRPANRRIKTISSMHLNTESPEIHFQPSVISKQHIFINNNFVYTDQKDHKNAEMTFLHDTKMMRQQMIESNRAKQIQDDNDQISRMKLMYQSRLQNQNQKHNKTNIYNKSMDRSPHSKSIQKHILKPTNTPNLKRVFLSSQQPQQQFFQQTQSPNFSYQNKHAQKQEMMSSQNSHPTDPATDCYETNDPLLPNTICPSISKRNLLEYSGISSKFAEYEFGSQIKASGPVDLNNKVSLREESAGECKKQVISDSHIRGVQQQIAPQCTCQHLLRQFMQQTSNKMAEITQRLMLLQNENARLKRLQSQFIQSTQLIQEYRQQVESMETKCSQLKESNYCYKTEKEELELLLKEILFKREKEKYQRTSVSSSKENTQRYDNGSRSRVGRNSTQSMAEVEEVGEECNNEDNMLREKKGDASFKKDHSFIVKKSVEPLGQKSTNTNTNPPQKPQKFDKKSQHQSDSKIKMQNLLSKIQIKIQKS